MRLKITPKSENTCAVRYVYQKSNQEIKFGLQLNSFEIIVSDTSDWLKNYSKKNGVCIEDVDHISESFYQKNPKHLIFFSETVREKDKAKLTDIFEAYDDAPFLNFDFFIRKLGWKMSESGHFIWGELNIEELEESHTLLEKVNSLIDKSRDEIIVECGYLDDEGKIDYISFYDDFCEEIDWNSIDYDTQFCYDIVKKRQSLHLPMLDYEGEEIIGQYMLRVSDSVSNLDDVWTEEQWDKESSKYEDYCPFEGPFETGNPHGSKGYYYGHMSLEDAFLAFEGDIHQAFRPAYAEFTADFEGYSFNDYLSEYGEHPRELIEFIERYKSSLEE